MSDVPTLFRQVQFGQALALAAHVRVWVGVSATLFRQLSKQNFRVNAGVLTLQEALHGAVHVAVFGGEGVRGTGSGVEKILRLVIASQLVPLSLNLFNHFPRVEGGEKVLLAITLCRFGTRVLRCVGAGVVS